MFAAVRDTADAHDVRVVYRAQEPAVRAIAERALGGHPRITLVEPLGYADFSNFMARCAFMLTDSGGVREKHRPRRARARARDDTERRSA
ncbi:MAG: UDP-N-acetylglucosamine 2-epimerase [Eggerthella lenta]